MALSQNCFSGSNICLRDYPDPSRHIFSVIISTATATATEEEPSTTLDTVIIVEAGSLLQDKVAQEVQSLLTTLQGSLCEVASVSNIDSIDLRKKSCVFLPELESSFLYGIHDDMFGILRNLVGSAALLVWVTHGGDEASKKPEASLVTGLARSICSEEDDSSFVTLALSQASSTTKIASQIIKILQRPPRTLRGNNDSEYMEKNGMLYIGRVLEAQHLNDGIFTKMVGRNVERRALEKEAGRPLRLTIASPGLLDTFYFVDDEVYEKPLAADEVEIEVKVTGLNFKDVMIALGQVPEKNLGQECAGVLSRVGSSIEHLKSGDRVCGATGGAFKTYVRCSAEFVVKIPDWMDFRIAATLPVVYCTAYYALHYLARLKERESILIHSGAGGVGQAAIQLAKLVNADIYVSVGSDEKKKLLKDLYDIPDEKFFSSRNMTFAQSIKRMTKGRGVDVVLNSLAGESLQKSWEFIAPFGRFIEIGKTDIQSHSHLSMSPFARNTMFASVDLGVIADKAKPFMGELMRAVMTLLTDEPIKIYAPQPLHVYNGSHLEDAFRFLQTGKNTGKTVVEFRKEDIIHVSKTSPR